MNTLGGQVVFRVGPLPITDTVLTTWGIVLLLALAAFVLSRRLRATPGRWQSAVEGALAAAEAAVAEVLPASAVRRVLPFVATLWLFILVANLAGLVPGLHAPTRDLSATSALALLVFASTHWYGIRAQGWRVYLRHYVEPSPILLPFHVVSEFTRTLALAVRLFGNMMSLEMAALLVLLIAGFLVPVPLLMLHVVEAVVQAYIFGMLALIYIAGALESPESPSSEEPS
ncbi:MAG: F0F1 ATP synthase subunit A [Betaproteobacteria bacterium]|nr:F0F1 ATP synthase subunit A [Betaproteobacteria bacterium]MDE2622452.1 F0F1 ATP synthase subunit A [Betaproteobacteria bacterium]